VLKSYRKIGFAFLLLAAVLLTACATTHQKSDKPLLPGAEWRITRTVNGTRQPVMDAPKWSSENELTLLDDATGLLWSKRSFALPVGKTFEDARSYCKSLGGPEMQIPTRQQLQTLVNYKYANPVVDHDRLPGIRSGPYWTATPSDINGADKDSYWLIDFLDGRSFSRNAKGNLAGVLCVADFYEAKPDSHYTDRGSWVEDNATGLGWQKQTVHANDANALADACLGSGLGGKRWRVPAQHELLSLVSAGQSRPYLDPLFSGELYLSSSTADLHRVGSDFYGVDFQRGVTVPGDGMHTRCVSQWPDNKMTGRTYEGSVFIDASNIDDANRQLQLFETGHYRKIHGDLYIHGPVAAVILPYLEEVTGSISVDRSAKIHTVAIPFLTTIGGELSAVGNAALDRLVFPGLAGIGGNLTLIKNANLGSKQEQIPLNDEIVEPFDFRSLKTIGGDVSIQAHQQLKMLSITSPISVGKSVSIGDNPQLRTIRMTSLALIGQSCGPGSGDCGSLEILSNMRLASVDFASLKTIVAGFSVRGNPELKDVQERIDRIGTGLVAQYNRKLCARTVLDRILLRTWNSGHFPGGVTITDNDPAPECKTACSDRDHCTIPHAKAVPRR